MKIRELTAENERREAVPILRQLWGHKTPEEVFKWTGGDDYYLFGGFVDDELVAVAGVLERHVLHHVQHAWLYDLVVDDSQRGQGYGASIVDHVETWAEDRGCDYVSLACPFDNQDAHKFYESIDYEKWGHVIEKEL
ncbi:MAG: GNAT family N-acetyltransferase [Haloplanus sp.]